MTKLTPEQERARARLRTLAAKRQRLAEDELAAVLAALRAGVRQADVARDLDRSREHIRRITRAADIPAPATTEDTTR